MSLTLFNSKDGTVIPIEDYSPKSNGKTFTELPVEYSMQGSAQWTNKPKGFKVSLGITRTERVI